MSVQVFDAPKVLTGGEDNTMTPELIYRQMAEFDLLTNQTTYKVTVENFLSIIFQETNGFQIFHRYVPFISRFCVNNTVNFSLETLV